MTEAQLTSDVLSRLRKHFPAFAGIYGPAVVKKINDRMSGGIPDVYVAVNGLQTWIEFKRRLTPGEALSFTPAQKREFPLYYRATKGRLYVVVATIRTGQWDVFDFIEMAAGQTTPRYSCKDRNALVDTLRTITTNARGINDYL